MTRPLVLRPPYGSGQGQGVSISESKLPDGPPTQRGLSLSPDIPGAATFAKPSDEPPRKQRKDDESIHRIDDADDLLKDQTVPDSIDHSELKPTYQSPGKQDGSPKTKYPYRDGVPNRHNAASLIASVVEGWLLDQAPEREVQVSQPLKIAAKLDGIEQGLNPAIQDRGSSCKVSLKRADRANLRWIFAVNCGNGAKAVRLKATRKRNTVALAKMEVLFSCSCPAWRWLGPEFHAKGEAYLDGKARGTASTPDIKDPNRENRVCKHVAAVISQIRSWEIPAKTK